MLGNGDIDSSVFPSHIGKNPPETDSVQFPHESGRKWKYPLPVLLHDKIPRSPNPFDLERNKL